MKKFITSEGGFTLIELLVVILILAILIAVAAPSFLGQTEKAQDSAAKQDIAIAYKASKASAVFMPEQGQWVDAPDAKDYIGNAVPDGRPDPVVNTGPGGTPLAGEFDEDDLVAAILASEPQFDVNNGGGLDASFGVLQSANPDDDAAIVMPSSLPPLMYIGVTCGAPGDCSDQTLHIYVLSASGKAWKVSVPENGAMSGFLHSEGGPFAP